mmetsp:Transcript_16064/g.28125  ORF Transcript_16064/g.28125 Transcript_16064/m.28125 type:complete len:273 (-) Transcript_16064:1971-2789(-)
MEGKVMRVGFDGCGGLSGYRELMYLRPGAADWAVMHSTSSAGGAAACCLGCFNPCSWRVCTLIRVGGIWVRSTPWASPSASPAGVSRKPLQLQRGLVLHSQLLRGRAALDLGLSHPAVVRRVGVRRELAHFLAFRIEDRHEHGPCVVLLRFIILQLLAADLRVLLLLLNGQSFPLSFLPLYLGLGPGQLSLPARSFLPFPGFPLEGNDRLGPVHAVVGLDLNGCLVLKLPHIINLLLQPQHTVVQPRAVAAPATLNESGTPRAQRTVLLCHP